MIPYIYSCYDLPVDSGIDFPEPTLTQQHFQDECDLNLIMARATQTGELPPGRPTFYGDFTDIGDYQYTLEKIQRAQTEFMAMPAEIRDYFHNDPALLLDFVQDPSNLEQGRKLGIFDPEPSIASAKPVVSSVSETPVENKTA